MHLNSLVEPLVHSSRILCRGCVGDGRYKDAEHQTTDARPNLVILDREENPKEVTKH